MDSIRVEAKTVADAVTEASIQLGTSSDNIEYTVISEGSRGFFGIGGKKAVIDAKKKFTGAGPTGHRVRRFLMGGSGWPRLDYSGVMVMYCHNLIDMNYKV